MKETTAGLPACIDIDSIAEVLKELNPAQLKAVTSIDGPLLCLAGAGSGKTKVLTTRIAYMITRGEISPLNILALTFTRKAAEEMSNRLSSMVGEEAEEVALGTFHSIGARILRENGVALGVGTRFGIADDNDIGLRVRRVLKKLKIPNGTEGFKPRDVTKMVNRGKTYLTNHIYQEYLARKEEEDTQRYISIYRQPPLEIWSNIADEELDIPDPRLFGSIYNAYQEELLKDDALDFQDLISMPIILFLQRKNVLDSYRRKWKYITVDEYQDTDAVQEIFLRLLAEPTNNLCVVGDDDQSIYGWRGAEVKNIREFPGRYNCPGSVVMLEDNYRSTANIITIANAVLAEQKDRPFEKILRPTLPEGTPVRVWSSASQEMEAFAIVEEIEDLLVKRVISSYSEVYILYRLNALAEPIEAALRRQNISYRMVTSSRFYDRRETRDLMAYLRISDNWYDSASFERLALNTLKGIGAATVETLIQLARVEAVSCVEMALMAHKIPRIKQEQVKVLKEFGELLKSITEAATKRNVSSTIHYILQTTNYRGDIIANMVIAEEDWDDEEVEKLRKALFTIDDFIHFVEDFERRQIKEEKSVTHFLHTFSTFTLGDSTKEQDNDTSEGFRGHVNLMSIHASKGLEAPVVFVVGLEEEVLPAVYGGADVSEEVRDKGLEEEERLFYVAVTRARRLLYLSHSRSRELRRGDLRPMRKSRFLSRLPDFGYVIENKA